MLSVKEEKTHNLGRMSDTEYDALWGKKDRGVRGGRNLRRLTEEEYQALAKEAGIDVKPSADLKKKYNRKYTKKKNL